MADEIPVSDLLCEAMEYLTKLGSNLQTRSENLKQKKINKNKLKNTHAIQTAAAKVLLICELSKKSLENVENGVRRVLSHVDTLQASSNNGAKSSTQDKDAIIPSSSRKKNKVHYHFFEYDSRKLRIVKKISLNHYTSVQVLAKRMPESMLNKYPVYHNCKLYRIRQKLKNDDSSVENSDSLDKNKSASEESNKDDSEHESNEERKRFKKKLKKTKHRMKPRRESSENNESDVETDKNKKKNSDQTNLSSSVSEATGNRSDKELERCSEPESQDDVFKKNRNGVYEQVKIDLEPTLSNVKESEKILGESVDNLILMKEEEKNENKKWKVGLESEIVKDLQKVESKESQKSDSKKKSKFRKQNESKKKYRRVRFSNDSSDDSSQDDPNKNSKDCTSENAEINLVSDEKNARNEQLKVAEIASESNDEDIASSKKLADNKEKNKDLETSEEVRKPLIKCVKLSNDSSDDSSQDDPNKNSKDCTTENAEINLVSDEENARNEQLKVAEIASGSNDEDIASSKKLADNKEKDKNSETSEEVRKPLIKCVNINKLLKPDIVQKSNECVQNSKSNKSNSNEIKKTSRNFKVENEKRKENKYWKQKRKEVKAFKPKKFTIHVTRLPKLSDEFLIKYNLKRIIQNGQIISEMKQSLEEESQPEVSIFKDALNNSSKDIAIEESTVLDSEDVQRVKNALLNESDSEKSLKNSHENSPKSTENIKEALLKDSDSADNDATEKEKEKVIENIDISAENDSNDKLKNLMQSDNLDIDKNVASNNTEEKDDLLQSETEISRKRKKRFGKTPHSKRKHVMESMHAKMMLLTYSSSDTEDEKLKATLKEINDYLLKGISSDDEDNLPILERRNRKLKLQREDEKKESEKNNNSSNEDSDVTIAEDIEKDSSSDKMGRTKAKPSQASSSINSDNQDASDKDIDSLTNLKTLNKTHRRSDSTSTEKSEDSNPKKNKSKKPSEAKLLEDHTLDAESSSSLVSGADSDAGDDLLTVPLTDLNGDGNSHFAKNDLLEESVSSSSEKDKSSEKTKKEDDSDLDESVKSKRRKANAISSDSEAGSSRKKDKDVTVRVSDFEDSDEESSEPAKRSKRKKDSESDASVGASSSDGNKKKRRRIKQVNDSDASASDTETEGRNKHGRKNIRKVMSKDQLEEATKKAAREEKERIARIAERQKMYNNVEFDESGKPDEVVLEKVVLDFEPETKEPLIEVDRGLVKKLKPHQANGIKFMWDACFESVKRIKKDKGSGCILAHCMGLGKTLQVVTLTHTLLTHSDLTGVKRALIVCPLSTVLNWVNEFRMWLKHAEAEYEVDVYELSRYKQNSERAFQLQQWFEGGGVCVLGYEMFRNLSADNAKKFRKKMLRSFQESLVDPGPDLVVCDEGHLLKNEKTSLSQSMNRVRTLRRIVLTGTPLQNNLKEYYCMVQFVKPNLLGKYNEYLNRFVNPITNGQYTDSTEHDIRVMKRRSHVLHKMLDGAVQRRDYGVLAPFLPPKHEYVLFITLTEVQIKLYQFYLDNYSRRPLPGKSSGFLFPDFQSLQRIWTHPLVLKYNSERFEIMQQKKREREEEDSEGSLADFIDDDSTPEETSTEESSDDTSDVSDDSRKKSKKKKNAKKSKSKDTKVTTRRGTRANPVELEDDEKASSDVEEVKYENPTEWWIKLVNDDELDDLRNSHKLVLLFNILRQCEAIGDKVLVFSQSLYSLDLIEHFLGKIDEATQEGRIDEKLGGHVGSWSPGIDYFRLDGSTSCENRSIWCKNFNREDNPRARLFLISTRAGGLGINLVAANRVVIFDVSWNPSHDVQSIFRVYRFGQKKPCYIYRFLAMGTMEEKIYERQVTKQAISKRVIDEQQIDRHYAENDLAELYKFEPHPPAPRPLPALPRDRLFAEMLKEHETQIYKYHEHDSLLENKEEETLSEEERKAAWEDFENEKNRPPPAPFATAWPMHNGMAPGLIAQQQQQLAYAALAAMLRKDMPNINDDQIRNMLPLIYNSNPGLMQKMSEIYKYAQPGMMNPAMMNPVMNSSGMGGTSGLQYEPPWQRQQQQQQQMRLQQLIQQQNQMGAKYYAGGLGSRDPVAMALQQQRAREMMLGERGRPRGRPPLQPRTSHPQDVVNLADSD